MQILLTGAAGFIGSTLAQSLLSQGHQVIGVDDLADYYDVDQKRANLAPSLSHDSYEFIEARLESAEVLSRAAQCEVVFHLAGQPGVRPSWQSSFDVYLDRNVAATQALLEAVRGSDHLTRMVYASSSSVYGNQASYPCHEDQEVHPFSPYGVTKLAAEHLCRLYAANFGVPTVSLRYFTVYGPRQRPDMAFSKWIRAARAREPITVTGDGEQVRDFTFVEDVAEATSRAGFADLEPGEVINVAGVESVSVNGVLEVLGTLVSEPLDIAPIPRVPGDVERTGGDTERARKLLGWTPQVPLAAGLARQVAWESAR